ncbi:MAG: FAD-dependent oxidoreductase [Aquabacterium sp.]|nr:FAD-dependent oxidoreductase [Aquabacterium sp.]
MATDMDLVVLGGGCAGLSLALRLAERPGLCRRVAVLEARPAYHHDRSWCFWRAGPHRFEPLVKRSWSQVALRHQGQVVQVDCSRTPYQLLESGAFYDHARQAIQAGTAVTLQTGVTVLGPPRPVAGGWQLETSAGALTAAQVIDTRPPKPPRRGDALLWQSFLGEELVCDRAVFNPGQVELMDFATDITGAVAFTYVLPLAADRALVETTLFDPQPHGPAELAERQQRAVQRLCDGAWAQVLRTEAGILPMGMASEAAASVSSYRQAGLMCGAARPATGYAFQRIQRWADGCSAALRSGQDPVGHAPDPLLTRLMDRLFLDVLRHHPERGPELFTDLFARTATPRIVRFLSDRSSFLDRVAVAASLPTGLFLRQLLGATSPVAARPQST